MKRSALRRGLALVVALARLAPGPLAIAVAGAAVFAGTTVLATIVLGWVTDDLVLPTFAGDPPPDRRLLLGAAGIIALTLVRMSGVIARRYFGSMAGERIRRSLRHDLIDHYVSLPLSWYENVPAGELLARADNDTEITGEVIHPLPFTLGVFFLAGFSAISLLLVDPLLAVVAFAIFPTLILLNRVYSRVVEAPAAAVQAGVGAVSAVAHESFDGALVVKSLGRSAEESTRFAAEVDLLRRDRVRVGYYRAAFGAAMDLLPNLGIVIVIIVGTYRIEAGAVRPGQMVQVAALFSVLAFPMRVFGFFLESLPPSMVARDRLDDVLDEPIPAAGTVAELPPGPLPVNLVDVGFDWPDGTAVLDAVDLRLVPGEVVALVGSTGEGKSTLANITTGLLPAGKGEVLLGGIPIGDIDQQARTDAVALVFQESFLFAASLRSNIDVAGKATDSEVRAAVQTARIGDFIESLPDGLGTVVGERGVTLSGGQRQRVALARALLRRPRLLVLDDATSAVDAQVEQEILTGLAQTLDTTTLIIAQRLSTITLADRVVYLDAGRVAGDGTHEQLLTIPGYASLVQAYEAASR